MKCVKHCIMNTIFAGLVSTGVASTNQALADPAHPPGLSFQKERFGPSSDRIVDRIDCPGLATSIWSLLMDAEEYASLIDGLADYYSDASRGGRHLPPGRHEWVGQRYSPDPGETVGERVLGLMIKRNNLELHEHAASITDDQYPDAVLKLHIYQHLAEECVFASGKLESDYDGWRLFDEKVFTAQCGELNDTSSAVDACVDSVLPDVNSRHQWELRFSDR